MTTDKENATKAAQAADILHSDIQAMTGSDNELLAEYATSILHRFVAIERELERLVEVVE